MPELAGAEIVVVGAGLAGATVARGLAERGVTVTVFEAERPAAGASGAAVGALHPFTGMRLSLRDEHLEGFAFTRRLLQRLAGPPSSSERAKIWRETPILRLVIKAPQAERWRNTAQKLARHGVRWLERDELQTIEARLQPQVRGGVLIPEGLFVDVPAFVRQLLDHPHIEVRDQHVVSDAYERGEHATVVVEGSAQRFDGLVIASGAQAPAPLRDVFVEMAPYRGTLALYTGLRPPDVALNHRGYISEWRDGRVLVGTVDRHPPFAEVDEHEVLEEVHARLCDILDLRDEAPQRVMHWSGIRPALRSRVPMGERPVGFARTWIFTGFGGKGLLVGPQLGDRLAEEIALGLVRRE